MIAFAKLQELIGGRPITYPGQQFVNGSSLLAALVAFGIALVAGVQDEWLLWVLDRRRARSSASSSCSRSAAPTCRS